jgi:2,4-dienoyl-CoA reductase (NADPH2)
MRAEHGDGIRFRRVHLIGGTHEAAELDHKRAILQGTTLTAAL